jgi:hypothetical protein
MGARQVMESANASIEEIRQVGTAVGMAALAGALDQLEGAWCVLTFTDPGQVQARPWVISAAGLIVQRYRQRRVLSYASAVQKHVSEVRAADAGTAVARHSKKRCGTGKVDRHPAAVPCHKAQIVAGMGLAVSTGQIEVTQGLGAVLWDSGACKMHATELIASTGVAPFTRSGKECDGARRIRRYTETAVVQVAQVSAGGRHVACTGLLEQRDNTTVISVHSLAGAGFSGKVTGQRIARGALRLSRALCLGWPWVQANNTQGEP